MNFTHATQTTQNLVIDSSGIDITDPTGALTTLRDGKVGIGTSSPQANLDVRGSARFYTSSMLVSEFQTNAGVARFAGIMFGINAGGSLYTAAANGYRIYLSYDLRDLYNATYGTTGPLPGAYDYSGVAGYESHFYATWQTPSQEVLDNILKLVPSVTFDNGNVGIGTNTPEAPLDVNGWRYSTGGGVWSFFGHSSTTTTLGYNSSAKNDTPIAIKSNASIWITGAGDASYFLTSSDSRIKTEIELVNDKTALDKVNRIECKEYHYKDGRKRESVKTIGFIAQEVHDILPNAIILQTSFIPDELRVLDNAEWNTLEDKYSITIPDLDISNNNTGKCRFYVSNDPSGNDEVMREVTVESDNKTFVFDESWNNVFFYGKEVNDFHTIDKNKIFQLHHPAIQELSRLNDEKTEQIEALQQHNEALETELSTVKTQLAGLEAKVNELLAKNA